MQRRKPPQDHTTGRAAGNMPLVVIGHVRSPYTERFGTPRQPTVTAQTSHGAAVEAAIELLPEYTPGLKDLAGFEYVWVLAWLHLNAHWKAQVVPPRGPKVPRGVFATRAPHRPNPIALSALKLLGVQGNVVRVLGIDLLDGTPVLDLKPYVPYADAFAGARAGWLDEIGQAPDGPDRFE
jgi:tRNA-Thr(GGU) m(6)t(6)A37 methyltransferase TsaA